MSPGPFLALVDDIPKACGVAVLVVLGVFGVWAATARTSRRAMLIRRAFRFSGLPGAVLVVVLASTLLLVVAEDVLNRERDQLVLQVDAAVRDAGRLAAQHPGVRTTAVVVSRATGEGLIVLVGGVALLLGIARRYRDAAVLLAGTASAWLLANGLKLAFAVQRPGRRPTVYGISGYGFPSAHALVTLVACGLIAWIVGRRASHRARLWLYAAALAVAALSSASRIVLTAHWASDVAAGIAVGLLWLVAVTQAASRLGYTAAAASR